MAEKIDITIFQDFEREIGEIAKTPVIIFDTKKIDELIIIIKRNDAILKHFSESELRQEIGTFLSSLQASPPKNHDILIGQIKAFYDSLTHEKKYSAIIILEGISGIPIGTVIGSFEIIEPDVSNSRFMEYLENEQKNMIHALKDCLWGKIFFNSFKIHRVRETLFEKLEFPFSILTFILKRKIDPNEVIGAFFSENGKMQILCSIKGTSWTQFDKKYETSLKRLSEISIKTKPTEVESKILRSLDIFWLSQLTPKKEIEFLLLISTLESLLLTKNDRDYLGQRLAEKSAFLLEHNEENRIQTYKSIKKMYNLRSKLVHEGEKKIDESELNQLKPLVYQIILKMIELSSIYDKMELKSKPSEKEGIDDMFMKLKFEGMQKIDKPN